MLFSEPKIPQSREFRIRRIFEVCFSALQRAENSSISERAASQPARAIGFSALQRAENSSICAPASLPAARPSVSVLFSEPKIPQSVADDVEPPTALVSVLFSEPKIPQSTCRRNASSRQGRFSALQRAENSSISVGTGRPVAVRMFQCSSASRKFLNFDGWGVVHVAGTVSVLFSEPKIPQSRYTLAPVTPPPKFQCSSASRKFLNCLAHCRA